MSASASDATAPIVSNANAALKQTPLNSMHRSMGARMVDFGGWEMPVSYPLGTVQEHLRTRTVGGLFDVSHMGEFEVRGKDAIAFVNRLVSNDVRKLVDGQAHYSAITTERGTVVDDLLVYRFAEDYLLLVVNASTTEKDWEWFNSHKSEADGDVALINRSLAYCQIAIQGPRAQNILQPFTDTKLDEIRYYHFREGVVAGAPSIISRTGYTGEDGFEIYAEATKADELWQTFLDAGNYGAPDGIAACGLAARNTLRLEAAMSLYGHEINDETTLLEANLGWITKLDKPAFTGREALIKQKQEGIKRKLVGFEMRDKGIARDGQKVLINGVEAGVVTSGSPAPYLNKNIGLAFVPVEFAETGREIQIDVRGRALAAEIVPTPFYKREK